MSKLYSPKATNKIQNGKELDSQKCSSNQYPWFSFRYMTTNSNYTIYGLNNGKESNETLHGLHDKLNELSMQTWAYWLSKPKASGIETIKFEQLNFSPNSMMFKECHFDKNSSVYVVRFDTYQGKNKGRIIGIKDSPCSVLHVIGYDFDFSAYKHG